MNAKEFQQEISQASRAIVPITQNDFVCVQTQRRGFACRLVRSLEADSDASELLAEYTADTFTEIVQQARQARKDHRGTVGQKA